MPSPYIFPQAMLIGLGNMVFGDPVYFDSFCFVKAQGQFKFGDFCHVHYYASITGREAFTMGNFCSLGPRVQVMTSTFLPGGVHNSTVPHDCNVIESAPVVMGDHSAFGSACIVYPGVILEEGVMFLPQSIVRPKDDGPYRAWGVYSGARRVRDFTESEIKMYHENVVKAREERDLGWRSVVETDLEILQTQGWDL